MTGRIILPALRWLTGLDRSYFFALSAFVMGMVASLSLAFVVSYERTDGSSRTLIEQNGAFVILLLVLPVLVLGTPLIALPRRPGPRSKNDKINGVASTVVLLAFVAISIWSLGIFYIPALILSTASSVSLYFGKNRKGVPVPANRLDRDTDGDGSMRLSRSAQKRLRQREQVSGSNAGSDGESPLQSSRRRRGRSRRKK